MTLFIISLLLIYLGIVIFKPFVGGWLILIFLPAYLLRFSLAGLPTTWLEMAIYLWALVTFVDLFFQKRMKSAIEIVYKKLKPFFWPLLLFFLAALISVFVSQNLLKAAGAFKAWVFDPVLFLVLFVYYYSFKDYKKIVLAISGCLSLVSIWGLVEFFGGFGMQIPGFINAMYQSANMVALLLVPLWFVIFGFLLGRFFQSLSSDKLTKTDLFIFFKSRLVIYLSVILLLAGLTIYLTRSYAGLLAWFFGILLFIIFIPKNFFRVRRTIFVSFFAIVLLVFVGLLHQGKLQRFFDNSSYNSWQTRQQIWRVAVSLLRDNYLLGVGYNNFEKSYYKRAFTLYNPPLEWEVPKAHNLYLNTWLESGFLGLVSLLWLSVVFLLLAGVNLKKSLALKDDKFNYYFIVFGLIVSLISILVHGIFDTPYFKNDLSVLWWLIFGLLAILNYDFGKLRE